MSNKEFVHLHLHSQYSLLDGAIQIGDLMAKLNSEGSTACAVTDHGTMYGIIDFYKQALSAKIKPILGCEAYVAPDSRLNREYVRGSETNHHLVLLARNNVGLSNLQKLASKAQLEGFYYKPRIDKEILEEYSEGLVALSACLAGEIPRHIMAGNYQKAVEAAVYYRDLLGKDHFYLEVQDNGIPEQTIVNREIFKIAKETGIGLVATNDCHYLNKGDHASHQILMGIQMGITVSQKDKMFFEGDQLWVKSPAEMWASFGDTPEALTNTLKIAEMCSVSIKFGDLHLPKYEVPEGYTLASYFQHLSRQGLRKRLAHVPQSRHQEYYDRLELELNVIVDKGFDGYFLIVWDFMNYSRETGVPVGPGRGSGAGSLVAYSLGITDIDPIRFNLLFERFLNPERVSMPDFDIDFCMNRRGEVIQYVRNKYGNDRVSQIITFGKLLARGVIRDVGRVLEVPLKTVDKLAKQVPEAPGMTLKKALNLDPKLTDAFKEVEHGPELLEHARKLEGLTRNTGMHAAGIIISDAPLTDYVPVCRGQGQNDETVVLSQFEKDTMEYMGLIKFDFLGLKNLTIIDEAVKMVKETTGKDIDLATLPLDDDPSYDLLQRGDTTGVFQLESGGMKNLLKKLKPTVFEDIIALVALYRPGPIGSGMLDDFVQRKHGLQAVTYPVPVLEDVLKETYGIIVYQEQVMQIAQKLAGYSLGNADMLRRAMGKKKPEEMQKHKEIFLHGDEKLKIDGAVKKGFDPVRAEEIFDLMAKFAEYGFNKSHSAAYALVAYQTAYLKANYPVEYMAALLSCELGSGDKVVTFIDECKKMGIKVLPPDINKSGKGFIIDGSSIRFGMGAIKNVGGGAVDAILEARTAGGDFVSMYDFSRRVDLKSVNKKVVESLIKAGAFDCTGKNRRQLLQVYEKAMDFGSSDQKRKEVGIMTLEDFLGGAEEDGEENEFTAEDWPDVEEMPENELLKLEKEVLSFYITNHPLAVYSEIMEMFTTPTSLLPDLPDESQVTVGGLVKTVRGHLTKKQERMGFVTLEDLSGTVEVVAFPKTYQQALRHLEEDKILVVKGRLNISDERMSIVASEIMEIGEAIEKLSTGIRIRLNTVGFTRERAVHLKQIADTHRGNLPIEFEIEHPHKFRVYARAQEMRVSPSLGFLRQIDDLLGEGRYELLQEVMIPISADFTASVATEEDNGIEA